jgi:hypothetical protein
MEDLSLGLCEPGLKHPKEHTYALVPREYFIANLIRQT